MPIHCQIMELGKMSGRASRTAPATGLADPAARLEDLARRRAVAGNAWCPRLTAARILSGSAVHVKGFGSALVSARKRLMAAWGSTTERKRPRFRRRRLLELRSMRITEDASPTELTQRHLEDQIYAFHRIERDWKQQSQPLAHIERLAQLRKRYPYELKNRPPGCPDSQLMTCI